MITTFYIVFSIATVSPISIVTVCEFILLDFLFGAFYGGFLIAVIRRFKPIRIKYNEFTEKN